MKLRACQDPTGFEPGPKDFVVTYNNFVLLFSTKRQLLIFGALMDTNKHQEMIVYRFFSLDNQL
jgi:hypothetical protein